MAPERRRDADEQPQPFAQVGARLVDHALADESAHAVRQHVDLRDVIALDDLVQQLAERIGRVLERRRARVVEQQQLIVVGDGVGELAKQLALALLGFDLGEVELTLVGESGWTMFDDVELEDGTISRTPRWHVTGLDPADEDQPASDVGRRKALYERIKQMQHAFTSLAESPLNENLLYAGTDDGLVQVSEDGGDADADIRAEATNALLLDNGDFLQGNPMGDYIAYERGMKEGDMHPMITAFNTLGIDAATIGNHEFNYGLPFLMNAMAGAAFPAVLANVATLVGLLGTILGLDDPVERDRATSIVSALLFERGVGIVRVHDVRAATDAVRAFEACVRSCPNGTSLVL